MRLDRFDALLSLLILVHGPISVYRLTGLLIESGAVSLPPSGFKSVEKSVASRLKKLEALGFVRKEGSDYVPTERLIIDDLTISGAYTGFETSLGWSVIFDTTNGHYVIFEVDSLLEDLPAPVVQKLFSGTAIYTTLADIISDQRIGGG